MKSVYVVKSPNPLHYVSYIVKKKGVEKSKRDNVMCFAYLFKDGFEGDEVVVYAPNNRICFPQPVIDRFVKEFNAVGFPVTCAEENDVSYFSFKVKDYTNGFQFRSALMAIRMLWEINIYHVADIFLQILDAVPEADRMYAFQMAHGYGWDIPNHFQPLNYNHMIKVPLPMPLVTRAEFAKLCADTTFGTPNVICMFPMLTTWKMAGFDGYGGRDSATNRSIDASYPKDFKERYDFLTKDIK